MPHVTTIPTSRGPAALYFHVSRYENRVWDNARGGYTGETETVVTREIRFELDNPTVINNVSYRVTGCYVQDITDGVPGKWRCQYAEARRMLATRDWSNRPTDAAARTALAFVEQLIPTASEHYTDLTELTCWHGQALADADRAHTVAQARQRELDSALEVLRKAQVQAVQYDPRLPAEVRDAARRLTDGWSDTAEELVAMAETITAPSLLDYADAA